METTGRLTTVEFPKEGRPFLIGEEWPTKDHDLTIAFRDSEEFKPSDDIRIAVYALPSSFARSEEEKLNATRHAFSMAIFWIDALRRFGYRCSLNDDMLVCPISDGAGKASDLAKNFDYSKVARETAIDTRVNKKAESRKRRSRSIS